MEKGLKLLQVNYLSSGLWEILGIIWEQFGNKKANQLDLLSPENRLLFVHLFEAVEGPFRLVSPDIPSEIMFQKHL